MRTLRDYCTSQDAFSCSLLMIQHTHIINEVSSSDVMAIVFSDVYGFAITYDEQGIRDRDHKMRKMYFVNIDLHNKRKLLITHIFLHAMIPQGPCHGQDSQNPSFKDKTSAFFYSSNFFRVVGSVISRHSMSLSSVT